MQEKLENIFLCRLFLAVNTHLKHQILQKWTICLETHAICYLLITCYIRLSDYIHKVFWNCCSIYIRKLFIGFLSYYTQDALHDFI